MTASTSRIFISYAHDSDDHRERALQLSNRLRDDGMDCHIDQYDEDKPVRWPQWMVNQLVKADHVLVVCSPMYCRRVNGEERRGWGAGAKWEGAIITQALYAAEGENSKFIPVIFSRTDEAHIPIVLRGVTRHLLDDDGGYLRLYRQLTDQPRVVKPGIGKRRKLPAGARGLTLSRVGERPVTVYTENVDETNSVFCLTREVRSSRMVSAVFSGKYNLLVPDEQRSVIQALLKMCDEENVVIGLAAIAQSAAEAARLEIVETVLDTAVFSRSLALKARVMRAFPVEVLLQADSRIRKVFFSEIVDIMKRNQYDEVNVITPAVVKVQEAIPPEVWREYVRALHAQANSRAFRGSPAAAAALERIRAEVEAARRAVNE